MRKEARVNGDVDGGHALDGGLLTFEGGFEGTEQSTEFTSFAVTGEPDDYETAHGTAEIGERNEDLISTIKLPL